MQLTGKEQKKGPPNLFSRLLVLSCQVCHRLHLNPSPFSLKLTDCISEITFSTAFVHDCCCSIGSFSFSITAQIVDRISIPIQFPAFQHSFSPSEHPFSTGKPDSCHRFPRRSSFLSAEAVSWHLAKGAEGTRA